MLPGAAAEGSTKLMNVPILIDGVMVGRCRLTPGQPRLVAALESETL